jgi:hypothetical protein
MLTSRELPWQEWPKLAGTGLEAGLGRLAPSFAKVVVVEDESGAVVACWAAMLMVHAEGLWIAPEHRLQVGVAVRLWRQMKRAVRAFGASSVMTGADRDDIAQLLEAHGGVKVPMQEYVLCL